MLITPNLAYREWEVIETPDPDERHGAGEDVGLKKVLMYNQIQP
jgi:hypothetical protein